MPPMAEERISGSHRAPDSSTIDRQSGATTGVSAAADADLGGALASGSPAAPASSWPPRMPSASWIGSGGYAWQPRGVVRLDLEQLDADESFVRAVGPAGEAVPLGPLAHQGRVGPAQVRAILGVIGQKDLRGVAMDRPFLGALGLAVVGEDRRWAGGAGPTGSSRRAPGSRQARRRPGRSPPGPGSRGVPRGRRWPAARSRRPGRRVSNQSTTLSMSATVGWYPGIR